MAIFEPNLTSRLLVKAGANFINSADCQILELGCGSGFISGQLLKLGLCSGQNIYMSDISSEAVDKAVQSFSGLVPETNFRVGSCLSPWQDQKFDLIISDVAGIANEVAKISSWYQGIEFEAGDDGLSNALIVLGSARNHLNPYGALLFPVLSLSDRFKLRTEISKVFKSWTETEEKLWPLPEELLNHDELLEELAAAGKIHLERKYGRLLGITSVAICRM